MRLEQLLDGIYNGKMRDDAKQWPVSFLSCDSREIEKDAMYFALKGQTFDGADFVDDVIERGARIIVLNDSLTGFGQNPDVCYLYVEDTNQFLRQVAKRFFNNPSERVKAIAVTGTNGKTTITYMIESILLATGLECSVIGTVNKRIGEKIFPSTHTTPGFLDNQKMFYDIAEEGVDYCVMEVSSHALVQGRIDLVEFDTAIFTNLTGDHLDYHKTMNNYFNAKSILFTDFPTLKNAVINVDDRYGRKLVSMTSANVLTYGLKNNADITAKDVQLNISGTSLKLNTPDGSAVIRTSLVGEFNVYNLLAAAAAAFAEGISLDKIKKGIEKMTHVPGRLERIDCGQDYSIFVDYAHTHDALENVLSAIRKTTDARVILVFGCGGDRDRTKRPLMGSVADKMADFTIVTSDNPRSEDPQGIIDEILAGFDGNQFTVVVDRKEAIEKALNMAKSGDVVLVAGKGHEMTQIFKDRVIKFDERQIIRQHLLT